jgi:hypothetical protein
MRAGYDCLTVAGIVGELDQRGRRIERCDHCTDGATKQPEFRTIDQQRDNVEKRGTLAICWPRRIHHSTQQDTNQGKYSPV